MSEINLEQARFNMVEQQIRPWDVADQAVLDLLMRLPREEFVPAEFRALALADTNTPIGEGQVMMPPKLEARMLQALAVQPDETVLEIGTGSGYVTALLASQARHVYSVEINPSLLETARDNLARQDIMNVTLELGDAASDWPQHGPYDVIVLTGSVPLAPEAFKSSLRVGGRLFAVIGDSPAMVATLVTRTGDDSWTTESLFETDLPVLENAPQPERFSL